MLKVNYQYPHFTDHTVAKGGFLTMDKRSHACFHYYIMCQKLLEKAGVTIDDQTRYEGENWWDKPYGAIAKSTAIIYGLDSPDDFLHSHWKSLVEKEAMRLGFPQPHMEYWFVEPGKVVEV